VLMRGAVGALAQFAFRPSPGGRCGIRGLDHPEVRSRPPILAALSASGGMHAMLDSSPRPMREALVDPTSTPPCFDGGPGRREEMRPVAWLA
jgi:hypothetical protein